MNTAHSVELYLCSASLRSGRRCPGAARLSVRSPGEHRRHRAALQHRFGRDVEYLRLEVLLVVFGSEVEAAHSHPAVLGHRDVFVQSGVLDRSEPGPAARRVPGR